MNLQVMSREEYEWDEHKERAFPDFDLGTTYDILDTMTDDDAIRLGFDAMNDVWEFVNREFTITE